MSILRHVRTADGGHWGYAFHCPGCDEEHAIPTKPYAGGWDFDGNEVAPTFTPSVLVYSHPALDDEGKRYDTPRCHSYVRAGQIQFLSDSTHALAGRTVALPELAR